MVKPQQTLRQALGRDSYRRAAVVLSLTLVMMWAMDTMWAGHQASPSQASSSAAVSSSGGSGAC